MAAVMCVMLVNAVRRCTADGAGAGGRGGPVVLFVLLLVVIGKTAAGG